MFFNQPRPQRLASAELRSTTITKFKEASQRHKELENDIEQLKLFLEREFQRCNEKADFLKNLYG